MFDTIAKNNDFDRRGNLKSCVYFSFMGEITSITIKQVISRNAPENQKESYSVVFTDAYGFECSYWSRNLTLEKAGKIMANIPREQTIKIQGEVNIRKGKTYFNARQFYYPDDSLIIPYAIGDLANENNAQEVESEGIPF